MTASSRRCINEPIGDSDQAARQGEGALEVMRARPHHAAGRSRRPLLDRDITPRLLLYDRCRRRRQFRQVCSPDATARWTRSWNRSAIIWYEGVA